MNDAFLRRERVIREQKMGRNVDCFSLKTASSVEVEASVKHYIKKTKYEFSKNQVI